VALSPDDQQLLAASTDKTAPLWSLSNQTLPIFVFRHDRAVRRAQFSPDGRQILTASWDGTVRLWRASNGQLNESILPHSSALADAHFSHDGRRIVTACTDGSLRVWDLAGKTMPQLVRAAAVSANGWFGAFTNGHEIVIRKIGADSEGLSRSMGPSACGECLSVTMATTSCWFGPTTARPDCSSERSRPAKSVAPTWHPHDPRRAVCGSEAGSGLCCAIPTSPPGCLPLGHHAIVRTR